MLKILGFVCALAAASVCFATDWKTEVKRIQKARLTYASQGDPYRILRAHPSWFAEDFEAYFLAPNKLLRDALYQNPPVGTAYRAQIEKALEELQVAYAYILLALRDEYDLKITDGETGIEGHKKPVVIFSDLAFPKDEVRYQVEHMEGAFIINEIVSTAQDSQKLAQRSKYFVDLLNKTRNDVRMFSQRSWAECTTVL